VAGRGLGGSWEGVLTKLTLASEVARRISVPDATHPKTQITEYLTLEVDACKFTINILFQAAMRACTRSYIEIVDSGSAAHPDLGFAYGGL
jgi:hypothetical protein